MMPYSMPMTPPPMTMSDRDERADRSEVLCGDAEDGRVIVHEGLGALHSGLAAGERSPVDPRDTRVEPGELDPRVELEELPLGSSRRRDRLSRRGF